MRIVLISLSCQYTHGCISITNGCPCVPPKMSFWGKKGSWKRICIKKQWWLMKLDHGHSSKHLYKVVIPFSILCRKGGRVFTFIKQIKQPAFVHFVKEKEMWSISIQKRIHHALYIYVYVTIISFVFYIEHLYKEPIPLTHCSSISITALWPLVCCVYNVLCESEFFLWMCNSA